MTSAADGEAAGGSGGIQSLARASRILEEIAAHRDGISLAQLARAVELHSSTTFHLAKTLVTLGYVRQDERTKLYRIGPTIFRLAATALDEVELVNAATPFLHDLVSRTGETSQLAIRLGSAAVVIAKSEAVGAFRITDGAGVTRPLHATAIGKVLLTEFDAASLDPFLDRLDLTALTPRTVTSARQLSAEIRDIADKGIAYEDGEFHPEVRCAAVPIRGFTGAVVASLAISAPIWRASQGDLRDKGVELLAVASALSASLGHRGE